ncbi:MAG: molybdenum cofactor biosynthesis protein MoaE [Acidobacteria bacterium]|nr:molybdenum cofactor biosynthesis protein MoaE [Acidobacteriota bacterium]MCA1648741.1 molybdenum cofactor biosynthesis protein MoaE [Acidobacteriota bacterium]
MSSAREAAQEHHRVTTAALDPGALVNSVAGPACGAVATFVGVVRDRNAGRRVLWIDYEAYAPLAHKAFDQIAREALERWPAVRLAIHHRIGRVAIGEASVAIAAASPHRAEGFAACRYAIERVKQMAPIWKHEHFEGGEVWIEGAPADPWDEDARRHALERACT